MLHWKKRISEWKRVVALAAHGAPFWWRARFYVVSALKMTRAILSGPVPAEVWRDRIRTCLKCPVLDRKMMVCRRVMPDGTIYGCQCSVTFLALTAAPYPEGCWFRQRVSYEGWASHRFASRREKWLAVCGFIFPAK